MDRQILSLGWIRENIACDIPIVIGKFIHCLFDPIKYWTIKGTDLINLLELSTSRLKRCKYDQDIEYDIILRSVSDSIIMGTQFIFKEAQFINGYKMYCHIKLGIVELPNKSWYYTVNNFRSSKSTMCWPPEFVKIAQVVHLKKITLSVEIETFKKKLYDEDNDNDNHEKDGGSGLINYLASKLQDCKDFYYSLFH